MAAEFTHLHLHTDYSLLDGACDVDKLAKHLKKIGQKSAAMTDHGNIFGAVHFFDAMKKKGIKPILGCELYICKEDDHRGKPRPGVEVQPSACAGRKRRGLPQPGAPYQSEAALHGFYRKPRVSKEFPGAAHGRPDRLFRLPGRRGLAAPDGGRLREGQAACGGHSRRCSAAATSSLRFRIMGWSQTRPSPRPCSHGADLDIPLIATNDSHYIADDDARSHEVLLCVQTADRMNDPKRFKLRHRTSSTSSPRTRWHGCFAHAPEVLRAHHAVSRALQPEAEQGQKSLSRLPRAGRHGPRRLLRAGLPRRAGRSVCATNVAHLRARGICCGDRSRSTSSVWTARSSASRT